MGVHLVSSVVGSSFVTAATMETAVNGFRKTGMFLTTNSVAWRQL